MKNIFVANWKARKTLKESVEWVQKVRTYLEESFEEIVLCPDFVSLPVIAGLVKDTSIKVGSQDLSQFNEGAYTGEVVGRALKDLVRYTLVGHSERRRYFNETTKVVIEKVKRAAEQDIIPLVCFEDFPQLKDFNEKYLSKNTKHSQLVIVYEPVLAIGTGQAEPQALAKKTLGEFKKIAGNEIKILYGGSVNPDNKDRYLQIGYNGLLIGTASLNPEEFVKIVGNQ